MPEELTIRIRAEGSEQVQRALAGIRQAVAEVGASVRSISQQTTSALAPLSQRLETLQRGFAGVAKVFENTGQTLRRWGTILTGSVIGTLGAATKTFMDFETRLMEIQTIAKLAPQDLQQMGKQIRQVAIESAQSFDTTARAVYQILSAGVDASKAIDVLRVSAKLATAGLADLEHTADAVTTVLNAYRLSTEQAKRVSDIMFKTVELGKTTIPELAAQIGRVASTAAQAGVSFEELSAAIAAMTAAGVQTEMAMSSLGQLLQNLLNPNKALTEALQKLGYSSGLALLQAKGLAGALELLSKAIPKEQLAEMIGSVEGLRAVMVLTGSQGDRFKQMLQEISHSAGATDRAFKTIASTTGFQLRQAVLSITDAFISLGSAVAPAVKTVAVAIKEVMDKLKESKEFDRFVKNLQEVAKQMGEDLAEKVKKVNNALERFNNLSDDTQKKIISWTITLGPLTLGLGVLAGALSNILNFLSKLLSGIKWLIEKLPILIGLIGKLPAGFVRAGVFSGLVATVAELGDWVRSRQRPSRPEAMEQIRRRFETSPLLREALAGAERQTAEFARLGQRVMEEMAKGMRRGEEKPAKAMDEALKEVRKRLPKSPPEVGPLKDIVEAGIKIPQLIAEGIRKGGQKAVEAMEQLAGHLIGIWSGWLRRFHLRGDIKVALARARGLPEEDILRVERIATMEQLAQTMRVLQRMKDFRRKGVPIAEEEILEIEREAAELQARLRDLAERQKELRYQRYLEEAEQAKIEEEREKLLQRELRGLPQPTPLFPPLEPLGDVERRTFEEAKEYMREIEAISQAYREMTRVAPELEGLPVVPPSPVAPLPEMERATEDLRRELEERAKLLDREAKLAELHAAIAKERNDPKAIQLELEAIEKRIEALKAQQRVVAMERDATEAILKALEVEREIAELEVKSAKIRKTVPPFVEGMGKVTEDFLRRLPEVVSGRIELQEAVKEFVRDIQEQIASELLKPLTEAIRKAMGNLANQISAALAQVLAQLPQSIQLGLGGLALFGGLRPITEAIEGVGKFITHTIGEVLKVFGIRIGGKKKASPPAVIPLGAAVYGPPINLSTAVTLQVDGRELGRVLVKQAV
jgi:TP901 family phage tail tape measure protein